MDETNFSLDGSDGGHGSQPACSITISNVARPGTGTNKSCVSSGLMLGSNASCEPLPVLTMFASKAKEESNYQIIPEWNLGTLCVSARFDHAEEKNFTSTVTANPKGEKT